MRHLTTPLSLEDVLSLKAGDEVALSGVVYGARDQAHLRLKEALEKGEELPIPLEGQVLYYVGPAPAKEGWAVGPAGPTTSSRMDPFTVPLLQKGLRGMIGKGYRSPEVKEALTICKAVYFVAVGGGAALLARHIASSRVVAYPELGPEAIYAFQFQAFPVIVALDAYGGDLYAEGRRPYARKPQ
ncbi:MAG: FumA C-terminus/TtdB family hydratase beta subunit [Clostridiales bacterium]|nr:FumA C-terminus/TtdB family hydratase beta subunit [Clostridiales bacterium]